MNDVVKTNIAFALDLLSQANNAMIKAIEMAVKSSDIEEVSFDETIDESCGYSENRTISFDEDGQLTIYDENGNDLECVEDLSANELYDICVQLS